MRSASIVSGYFNPLHVGHLRMMEAARALTGRLIVIVNNDAQQMLKKGRIILPLADRLEIVRALRVTDEAFPAIDDDATVRRTLRAVREKYPHTALVFANGGDRSSAARISEAGVCEELGIELRFGVGGEEKADSSTRIIAELGEDQVKGELLADFSLEVAGKDIGGLEKARGLLPPTTRFHMAFVDSENLANRMRTTRAIIQSGFAPVPVISARRLESEGMLRQYLTELRTVGAIERVVIVGGDPLQPRGPYPDAASVISSGALEQHGVREVSVAGHPGGHPAVTDAVLWQAIAAKIAALEQRGLRAGVITQFGFDAALVLAWLAELRTRGLTVPVRVGVPGPATVRTLLAAAAKCDVSVSAPVARKYGFSLDDRTGSAAPDWFIGALAAGYQRRLHGEVKLHFSTFNGVQDTAKWITQFRDE